MLFRSTFKDKSIFSATNPVATRPGEIGLDAKLRTNHIGSFQLNHLVPVFSFLSAVNHGWAFFDNKRYMQYVEAGYNPVRWAEFAVSAGIMNVVIGALSGLNDVKGWSYLLLSNAALQATGYAIERDTATSLNSLSRVHRRDSALAAQRLQVIGFLIFVSILAPIWTAFFTSIVQAPDPDDIPSFVWAIVFILTALYLTFGLVSLAYSRAALAEKGAPNGWLAFRQSNFRKIEVMYIILSFTSKTFLANMTLLGATNSRSTTTQA